jgi:AcrR family transcriptional regulator
MAGNQSSVWLRAERAEMGRPARRSRAEITAAALDIADRDGLDAVSMRRIAAELGTGAASLYRYVETREEVLDLMADAVGAERPLPAPTGDWLADLLAIGERSRALMRAHPWLPGLLIAHPVLGPNGVALLEHVLTLLQPHPADVPTKLEAFAMMNGITALFVQHELAGGSALQQRNVAYLQHAATSGEHPRLAQLLAQGQPTSPASSPDDYRPEDRYATVLTRILTGLLGPTPDPADR